MILICHVILQDLSVEYQKLPNLVAIGTAVVEI